MPKKNSPGQMGPFGPKNSTSSKLWISSKKIFKNLQNERGYKVCKKFISWFSRKQFIWGNLIFLILRPLFTASLGMFKLTQATVNWILKQSGHDFFHDYYWILKQSGHD